MAIRFAVWKAEQRNRDRHLVEPAAVTATGSPLAGFGGR
jgi:hypothetical protein